MVSGPIRQYSGFDRSAESLLGRAFRPDATVEVDFFFFIKSSFETLHLRRRPELSFCFTVLLFSLCLAFDACILLLFSHNASPLHIFNRLSANASRAQRHEWRDSEDPRRSAASTAASEPRSNLTGRFASSSVRNATRPTTSTRYVITAPLRS